MLVFDFSTKDDELVPLRVASDGRSLILEGSFSDNGASHGLSTHIKTKIPILALTSLEIEALAKQGAFRKEVSYMAEIRFAIWDGPECRSRKFRLNSIEEGRTIRALADEVIALNLKWPMSAQRAHAVRRSMTPGFLPKRQELLGMHGSREFSSCLDLVPRHIADAWASSPFANRWPRGVEAAGAEWPPARLPGVGAEEYANVPEPSNFWILLEDALVVCSQVNGVEFEALLFVDFVDLSLVMRREGDPEFHLCVTTNDGRSKTIRFPEKQRHTAQRVFRYLLSGWSLYRPFDESDFVGAAEELEQAFRQGTLDEVCFAALVSGIARRVSGEVPGMQYPIVDAPYLQTPATKPAHSGPTGPNVRQVAASAALITAAANMLNN